MMQAQTSWLLKLTEQEGESTWSLVASIISTVAWSVSFYGQVYENWKFKNVEGFSLDYLFLNIIGYTFYGIYSTVGFFNIATGAGNQLSHKNRQNYRLSLKGTVLLGDLIFVYHAIPLVLIQAAQCFYYPRGENRISNWSKILGGVLISGVFLEFFFTQVLFFLFKVIHAFDWTQYWNPVSALGYGKLIISFIKYSPAVYWNYKRKSTKGWSIFNILLDLVGGSFSLASGSISVQNGLNTTKLLLALLTVIYDLIFVFQHYVLYRKSAAQDEDTGRLIQNEHLQDLISVEEGQSNPEQQTQIIRQNKENAQND